MDPVVEPAEPVEPVPVEPAEGSTSPEPTSSSADDPTLGIASGGWTTPTRPPNCSTAAMSSGNVAGCVVSQSGSAERRGFGHAPNPATSPGFRFGGWSYSGPGVEAFAAEHLTANTTNVAGRSPGGLRTHVAAAALFEGFLDEIHRNGYPVRDAGAFVYRCTSGSAGNCTSGSMSLHTWGLAVDINAGANPERTYVANNGVSACAVPMTTDIPQWVVQTAERWGLFWGGYGWNSGGCTSPADWSDQIRRDPHHFEFRGTVDTALAITRHRGAALRPMYCTTIAPTSTGTVTACNNAGRPGIHSRTPVDLTVPRGATAVVVNVTAVGAAGAGYLTVEPCSAPAATERSTSNTNFVVAAAAANTAIVQLDRNPRICVYRSAPVHAIVDVLGYLVDGSSSLRFRPVAPERVTDTRSGGQCRPGQDCISGPLRAATVHEFPLDAETGAVVNVTAVGADSPGFVTADACGRLTDGRTPNTSTVNHDAVTARANLSFASSVAGRSCLWASANAHTLVDVTAVLGPSGDGIAPVTARRVLDTRGCAGGSCPRPAGGTVVQVPGLDAGRGHVLNVTVTDAERPGFVTVAACDRLAAGTTPSTSTVNLGPGEARANLALVPAGPTCAYTSTGAHLVIDVQATLHRDHRSGIRLDTPGRAADTRR